MALEAILELTISIEPHPMFRREGDDLACSIAVTIPQAVLGAEIEIPTLEGRGKLRVPPGTSSGTVFRVRGKGVARRTRSGRGDQLVEVNIDVPRDLTPRQRELFEELARELGTEVGSPEQKGFMQKLKELFG